MAERPRSSGVVERWCATAAGSIELREGALDRLEPVIPFDGAFFATVDPATLLYTSGVRRHMPAEASPAFIRTELGERDVNQLRVLARSRSPVGWLDAATQGRRMDSVRYREAMRPIGLGDELRVALRIDNTCWGLLCLHRSKAKAGFSVEETATLEALAPHLAEGIRRAAVADRTVEDMTTDGPGVVVIAPDRTVEATTTTAARWLAELAELDMPRIRPLPTAVAAVVERLDAAGRQGLSVIPRARVQVPSGRWLVVHCSYLQADDQQAGFAVVVEPAAPAVIAPVIVAAYGLTVRETDVVHRLLAGLARKSVAAELCISPHTVNDHVKAIFEKTGASSIGQLRARLSAEHFARPH